MWATIIGPFGPFFFESVEGKAQTINTERYIEKPEIFKQTLRQRRFALRDQWLMQNGAARYTSGECLRWLGRFFQEPVVSLKTDFEFTWLSWFVKKVAVTLKLRYLINFYCSFIKFAQHLLPYVDDNFCKYEIDRFFSFYFMAKTEGPVFIESACTKVK